MLEIFVDEGESRLLENGGLKAKLSFCIKDDTVEITTFWEGQQVEGLSALCALTRAALNHSEHLGAKKARCANAEYFDILCEECDFERQNNCCVLSDIEELFSKKCKSERRVGE